MRLWLLKSSEMYVPFSVAGIRIGLLIEKNVLTCNFDQLCDCPFDGGRKDSVSIHLRVKLNFYKDFVVFQVSQKSSYIFISFFFFDIFR